MRFKFVCLITLIIVGVVNAELSQKSTTTRDTKDTADTNKETTDKSTKSEPKEAEEKDDDLDVSVTVEAVSFGEENDLNDIGNEKTLEQLLAEELGIKGTIKVIRPELQHERDKVSDILTTLVSSHAMLINKFETQIKEIDGSLAAINEEEETEPPKEKTPEEIEADNLYETAMKIMNRTRSDKSAGFAILQQAASKGHAQAQAEVAWGQLLGNPVDIDVEAAKETFLKLAETGLPDAHMVRKKH